MKKDSKAAAIGTNTHREEANNTRLLHELQVYEVELEQQNNELRQTRKALEIAVERYSSLFEFAPIGYFTLRRDGTIAQANLAGSELLRTTCKQLTGKLLRNFVAADYQTDFDRMLSQATFSDENQICELAIERADAQPLFARLEARLNTACDEFMVVLVDLTERQQAMTSLLAANAQLAGLATERAIHLQTLSGELTRAEQRERDYFYELLHDHVQPLLVAARLGLSGLGTQTPRNELLSVIAETNGQISKVIQAARTLSVELSPPLIREKGLIPALESLCRWVQSNYGMMVDMDYDPEAEPVSMTIRLICFKAVRELLMNAVKYAGTQEAIMDIERESANMLCITIRDDGVGFDPGEIHGSGLANIERRLSMVGGTLSVESGPNAGTTATIRAPLEMRSAEKLMNSRGRRIGDASLGSQTGFAGKRFNQ